MARSKKEPKKATPEERLLDRWNQQIFFLKKQFPKSESKIAAIRKSCEKKGVFLPTEGALAQLTDLYVELRGPVIHHPMGLTPNTAAAMAAQQAQAQAQAQSLSMTASLAPTLN
jgi:hypothetical protein